MKKFLAIILSLSLALPAQGAVQVKQDGVDKGYVQRFDFKNGPVVTRTGIEAEIDLEEALWLIPPVEGEWDITGGLPVDPDDGDRYISDGTDEGLGWYDGYIYEWDEDDGEWIESIPVEGWMVWMLFELVFWVFFSGGWMEVGSGTYVPYDGAIYDVDLGSQDLTTTGLITGGTLSGGFTAGSVIFSDGSVLAQDNSNLFWNNTDKRLGIGTTSPTQQLDITKNFKLTNTTHANEYGIIYKGTTPFIHDFSYGNNGTITPSGRNVFIGESSGNFTMGSTATNVYESSDNIGLGTSVLFYNTTGYFNIGLGTYALLSNTTGNYNNAIGNSALRNNTTGTYNVAFGANSLFYNTTGIYNLAIGSSALNKNTEGDYNVGIGVDSLQNNTTGVYNVGIGRNALLSNTTSNYNTAIGRDSLYYNTTGEQNFALGYRAGRFLNDGSTPNRTGSYNLFLGPLSTPLADGDTNEIVIGYNANGIGSNSVVLGNDSITKTYLKGNVGIGTTSPTARLHLPAGTATASTAPLKFTAGTALTTPETGTIEFHNDRFWITNVDRRRAIDRTNDIITATTEVVNTTDETTIYTGYIEANGLKVGNVLKLHCDGIFSNNSASDDITIRIYIGTDELLSFNPAIGNVTDAHWHIQGNMTVRTTGASGTMAYHLDAIVDDHDTLITGLGSVDTTASQDFTVTVEWDNAKADNTIKIYQGFTEWKG